VTRWSGGQDTMSQVANCGDVGSDVVLGDRFVCHLRGEVRGELVAVPGLCEDFSKKGQG